MVKPGALLLLLAVAASQVDLTMAEAIDISTCPTTLYGLLYQWMTVDFSQTSVFAVCFTVQESDTPADCLQFEDGGVSKIAAFSIPVQDSSSGPTTCFVEITLSDIEGTQMMKIEVHDFDDQPPVKVTATSAFTGDTVVVNAVIGGSSLTSWTLTNSALQTGLFIDIRGCRHGDVPMLADSQWIDEDACTSSTCGPDLSLSTESTCSGFEVCQGNNICVVPTVVCTVTGNTVIDFFNVAYTIPDRCAYNLISPGFYYLRAVFQERRSKTMPFLDQLIIYDSDSGESIYLQQGGRVLYNGELLSLTTTPQVHLGVGLTKDQTGVTAMFDDIIVLFDGNTAHVSALIHEDSSELCGDPSDDSVTTTTSDEKSTDESAPGCESVYTFIPDPTIDCDAATASCERMNDAPFTACHTYIDQQPYVTACTMTSCSYPNVDGLICQYLEAYAMSCSLRNDITLGDWRSAAGCDVVLQHSCRDQYCSYFHEFCGEKLGETRCLCRALFAEAYKKTNSFGNATVCTQNTATLSLATCLLWDQGIDYTSLHLNDPDCVGDLDSDTNIVTFSFESNTCGTEIMLEDTKVVFKNAIMTRDTSMDSQINRHHEVQIDFSCYHVQPDIKTMSFHIADSSVMQYVESGVWSYTVTMNVYSDPAHQHLLTPDFDVTLNQMLWLKLTTDGLDGDRVAVVIDFCWATDQPLPDGTPSHSLIFEGCPSFDDDTVGVEHNGLGTFVLFSFSMFEFYGKGDDIYLHCKVELCPIGEAPCAPDCTGASARKRRSTRSEYAAGNPALITMAWKK